MCLIYDILNANGAYTCASRANILLCNTRAAFNDRAESLRQRTPQTLLLGISISSSNINTVSKALDTDATKIDVAGLLRKQGCACLCRRQEDRESSPFLTPDKTRSRNILCCDTNEMQMARLRVTDVWQHCLGFVRGVVLAVGG